MKIIEDVKEKQEIAYDILVYFSDVCTDNKLKYLLAYGTLLGAVRHKGFIPWDDDVDVMMFRDDYYRFVQIMEQQNHPYYKLISIQNNKDYFAPLAKLYDDRTSLIQEYGQEEPTPYGVYIDIFIVDFLPDNYRKAKRFYNKSVVLRLLWGLSIRSYSSKTRKIWNKFFRLPFMILCKMIGYKRWLRLYDHFSSIYNKKTNHAGIVLMGEGLNKEYHDLDMYYNYSELEFCGKLFRCPSNYDTYLTAMYGEYQVLPPIEDRKVHLNKAYWK